jgi:hypothetical protein
LSRCLHSLRNGQYFVRRGTETCNRAKLGTDLDIVVL